jgi:predicted cobalt transporter CbtA
MRETMTSIPLSRTRPLVLHALTYCSCKPPAIEDHQPRSAASEAAAATRSFAMRRLALVICHSFGRYR